MIVRSIQVSGWRCFLEPIQAGPFGDGLNVIHAPNGTGKSTLFEVLRRALLDGHRVSGRDVEAIRPWGRDLDPKVAIEFEHGGAGYRIRKAFLAGPSALLERLEDGHYRRLAEGSAADEQTRAILSGNPPGRGLARHENWGIAQVLWAPQGALRLEQLSGDLVADFRSILGDELSGGAGPIEQEIERRYLRHFTLKGKLKSGKDAPRLVQLKGELEPATRELQEARAAHSAFEEAARRVEDLRARRQQARREADELAGMLVKARERAEAYAGLTAERKQHEARARECEARHDRLKQRIDLIRSTGQEREAARAEAAALEERLPLQARELEDRKRGVERAKAALEDIRKGRENVDRAAELAEEGRRLVEIRQRSEEVATLAARVEEAEKRLAGLREARAGLAAPDGGTLRAVRQAVRERDEAQTLIDASLITLELVPAQPGRMEVLAGESPGTVGLEQGTPVQAKGSPEVVVQVGGFGRIRAWGPSGSIEEHRAARAGAERKLAQLTSPYGTADPHELELRSGRAAEMEAQIQATETELKTLLSGRTAADLAREAAVLRAEGEQVLRRHPQWKESPPEPRKLRAQAESRKKDFIRDVEDSEAAWDKAQQALNAVSGRMDVIGVQLDEQRKRAGTLGRKLADYESDGKGPVERGKELQEAAVAWDAARGLLEQVTARLAAFEDEPLGVADSLERRLEAAQRTAELAREQENREEARLETLAAQGPYSRLASAEERVARLERERADEQLQVDAVRLLQETVQACRSSALAAVMKPVEEIASRTFQRIAGRRLGRIRMAETLVPDTVQPDAAAEAVGLESLSGGEQEQLHLAARLALAEVLSRAERQLVVLDDVLTATDAGRLARVLAVLEEAAERLQLLILTCHPERYRGLRQAAFFDLEALTAAASAAAPV